VVPCVMAAAEASECAHTQPLATPLPPPPPHSLPAPHLHGGILQHGAQAVGNELVRPQRVAARVRGDGGDQVSRHGSQGGRRAHLRGINLHARRRPSEPLDHGSRRGLPWARRPRGAFRHTAPLARPGEQRHSPYGRATRCAVRPCGAMSARRLSARAASDLPLYATAGQRSERTAMPRRTRVQQQRVGPRTMRAIAQPSNFPTRSRAFNYIVGLSAARGRAA
jgi:hypothetical protein